MSKSANRRMKHLRGVVAAQGGHLALRDPPRDDRQDEPRHYGVGRKGAGGRTVYARTINGSAP